MTRTDAADRLTRAQRLYRAACEGAILVWPAYGREPSMTSLLAPLPAHHWRRAGLRERVRALERQVAAEKVRAAIRYVNGAGRRRAP